MRRLRNDFAVYTLFNSSCYLYKCTPLKGRDISLIVHLMLAKRESCEELLYCTQNLLVLLTRQANRIQAFQLHGEH